MNKIIKINKMKTIELKNKRKPCSYIFCVTQVE